MIVLLPILVVVGFALALWLTVATSLVDASAPTGMGSGMLGLLPTSAVLRPLFVVGTEDGIVLDGLLDLDSTPVGVPTTWRMRGPADADLRHQVLLVLQGWADEDAAVAVDLTALRDLEPSIGFECGDVRLRLALGRRTTPSGR